MQRFTSADQPLQLLVDAPAGYGKTAIAKVTAHFFRSKGMIVLPVAFASLAASAHEAGRTIHKSFWFPFSSKFEAQTHQAELFRSCHVFSVLRELTAGKLRLCVSADFPPRWQPEDSHRRIFYNRPDNTRSGRKAFSNSLRSS